MNVNATEKGKFSVSSVVAHLAGLTISKLKNIKRFEVRWGGIYILYRSS